MIAAIATALLGASALTLLGIGAWLDVRFRVIPNIVPAGLVAVFACYAAVALSLGDLPGHLAAAVALFLPAFLLWSRGLVGGGDVKLMTATALWAGLGDLGGFLLFTALAGGVLALAQALRAHWLMTLAATVPGLGSVVSTLTAGEQTPTHADVEPSTPPRPDRPTIPYGVAIATGGLSVLYQTFVA